MGYNMDPQGELKIVKVHQLKSLYDPNPYIVTCECHTIDSAPV